MREQATARVKIENERVRVTEWRFAPDEETGHHRHETDYIVVPLASGALRMENSDGTADMAELTAGEPYFRRAGVEHNVINASGKEFSFIEIEMF